MRPPILLAVVLALLSSAPAVAEPPHGVRAIALGPKLDLAAFEGPAGYQAEVERLMTLAHREFLPGGANLVVFGGDWGMLGALSGPEHRAARAAKTRLEAYEALRQAHYWEWLGLKLTRWGLSDQTATLLALTDRLYRPLVTTFSEAARRHGAYVLASGTVPDVDGMKPFQSLRTFPDRPVSPQGRALHMKAFLFDPDGRLVGEVKQSSLGAAERELELAAGSREYAHPFDLPFGKLGVAMGPDATDPDYLARLDDGGCQILAQPAVLPGVWAETAASGDWRPRAWLETTMGSLQASASRHVQYTVTPMPTGLYFETAFDGQSSIMARSESRPGRLFIGVDAPDQEVTGEVLALSPWVVEDPKFVHGSAGPATSLGDRQEYLRKVARTLMKGGKRENQFVEGVATADLVIR